MLRYLDIVVIFVGIYLFWGMNFWRNTKYFVTNLTIKHRLSLRSEHSRGELWYMHISPVKVIVGFLTLVLVLTVAIMLTVAYTPILDLIPGYPGIRSREMLIQNILRIDSLEQQMNSLEVYNSNMALIMSGRSPVTREILSEDSTRTRIDFVAPSEGDSILRLQMETEGPYSLSNTSTTSTSLSPEAFPPTSGTISTHFSPSDSRYGITMTVSADSEVVSMMEGTVVASQWNPNTGTAIYIQHSGDMISIYRNNLSSRVSTGQRVRAGEIIGYIISEDTGLSSEAASATPAMEQERSDRFEFELWRQGTPVDPENFIVF